MSNPKPNVIPLILVLVAMGVIGFVAVNLADTSGRPPLDTTEYATVWARDESGELLPEGAVNLWDDYDTRARVTGVARDGDKVRVLRRAGGGVQVKTLGGLEGWVSREFLRQQ